MQEKKTPAARKPLPNAGPVAISADKDEVDEIYK